MIHRFRWAIQRPGYKQIWTALFVCVLVLAGAAHGGRQISTASAANSAQPAGLRFAVIGDFGTAGAPIAAVSSMIKGWNPDLIITTGDNNYPLGSEQTIDLNIGQYFNGYIYPYHGSFAGGATSAPNRFFPAIGNHDMDGIGCRGNACSGPYLNYFTLPGNERYYDFVQGSVHFFMVNSDVREPDGNRADSVQAAWLRQQLAASTARWKIVVVHHAPYTSSNPNGPEVALRWPFADWGASIVLSGHDHNYERLLIDGFPYIVNGAGGNSLYPFGATAAGSIVRYNEDYGAMLVEATETTIRFQFYNRSQQLIDSYTLPDALPDPLPSPSPTPTPTTIGSIERQIATSSDDMEEVIGTGRMVQTSTDLEMTDDSAENGFQSVGLRFLDVNIPQGALISNAYLEFVVDESDSVATSLQIRSHALDHAQPFTLNNFDLTSRPLSNAVVNWQSIEPWSTVGALKRTPDLSAIVQEVTNRSGWQPGNALSLMITGTGHRTAVSFDGSSSQSARLHIDWQPASAATPTVQPTATAIPPTPSETVNATPISTPTSTPLSTPIAALSCEETGVSRGTVMREVWTHLHGSSVDDLLNEDEYPDTPDFTTMLTRLEAPTNWATDYATRIRGYLCPPASGDYLFWIASDDNSQLYLSSDVSQAKKQQIASVEVWTNARQWDRYATQKSAAIRLQAGVPYYFEVLHKQGEGWDNLAVAWQGPGLARQVIDGAYLMPYGGADTSGAVDVRVAQGRDDVEQSGERGTLYANSYDLDFGHDRGHRGEDRMVGIRFQKIMIPANATITNAYIEFTVAEADSSRNAFYQISAIASDHALPFDDGRYSLKSLPRTNSVNWRASSWRRVGEKQRTSELKSIVQEVIKRSGWRSGNALAFLFEGEDGRRSAYSYNGSAVKAPKLHIEWTLATETTARGTDPVDEVFAVPNLAVDYESGAPGSIFRLTGEHFAADSQVSVWIDGREASRVAVDERGIFEYDIDTTGKAEGIVTVATDVAPNEQTTFTLDRTQPLHLPTDDSKESNGNAMLYLPLINR